MARGVKWTDEENKILVQAIAANPHNLSEAIREASKNLNRTYKACSQHCVISSMMQDSSVVM